MPERPESFFLITYLFDADSPAGHRFVWSLKEALGIVASLASMPSIQVAEIHRTKGRRMVLQYAPDGLIVANHYETHTERWKKSYPTDFVDEHLAQWPKPIIPRCASSWCPPSAWR